MTERDISQLEATDGGCCRRDQLGPKIKTQRRQNVTTTWCVWRPHERKCVFWFSTAAEGGDIRENVALNYNSGSLAGMTRTLIIYTHSRTFFFFQVTLHLFT